ncbi:hypothetical protein JCM19240_3332 [Vibrio maritimus]|uniref:Uncharacterized protein n=1 Tax=Vibrio maritimus TaxID=990268 RepID=A0A090TVJ9_9VIBR|nr:hypothetical protein JCM19240_3332 [Vibrio maritimus]
MMRKQESAGDGVLEASPSLRRIKDDTIGLFLSGKNNVLTMSYD